LAASAVLGLLGARGPISRADIARILDLSPATVTQVTKGLLARGLVVELEHAPSQGGRPGRLLGLDSRSKGAFGAKVTDDYVAVVRMGLDGTVERSWTEAFEARRADAVDALAIYLARVLKDYDPTDTLGVGVAVPGSVDHQANGVVDAPTLGWRSLQVGQILRDRLQLPVLVENDVNAVTIAERLYGRGRQHDCFLTATIGRGVGAGLISDGALYRGAFGGAGEIGHFPVVSDGHPCSCGNQGCLEAIVGEQGLVRTAIERGVVRPSDGLGALREAARSGDPEALRVFADASEVLGRVLAGVVHVTDPEVVLILGEGVEDWPWWEAGFNSAFRSHLIQARRGIPVLVERWSDESWAQGAAALVLATPFDSSGTAGEQGRMMRARMAQPVPEGSVQ
jgi:predicted NBD/HSP70 family sugar kinase